MIYHSLNLKELKIKYDSEILTLYEYENLRIVDQRKIINYICDIKQINRKIDSFYMIITKEQLVDLFEMIISDLKEVRNRIEDLKSNLMVI